MKTRKRLREKDSDLRNKHPVEEIDGDFLDADYQKVQRLLEQSSKGSKFHKSNDHAYEDRSSTEAEFDTAHAVKGVKDNNSEHSANSSTKSLKNYREKKSRAGLNKSASDKERICLNSTKSHKSIDRNESERIDCALVLKKRTLKEQEKIKDGFSTFINLMIHLNSKELPKYLAQKLNSEVQVQRSRQVRNVPTMINQNEVSESISADPRGAFERPVTHVSHENMKALQFTPMDSSVNEAGSHRDVATSGRLLGSEEQSGVYMVGGEVADQASVSLVQPHQSSHNPHYEMHRTSTGYPLRTNQSLHVNCAYFISMVKMNFYYQELYMNMMQKDEDMKQQFEEVQRQKLEQGSVPGDRS